MIGMLSQGGIGLSSFQVRQLPPSMPVSQGQSL
jgi:hypothetical protein